MAVMTGVGFLPTMMDIYDEFEQDVRDVENMVEGEYDWLLDGQRTDGKGWNGMGTHTTEAVRSGQSCNTWGPSAWNSGKCDMETGIWYPEGVPEKRNVIGQSCASWSPTHHPNHSENCDFKTGIWYPDGAPKRPIDLSFPGELSLMPDYVQPQRMRMRPQGSTPYTRMSTQEIAAIAHQPDALGIFIPAHFTDFVKSSLQNVTPRMVSYYLAYSWPRPQDYRPGACTRPGVFYSFV